MFKHGGANRMDDGGKTRAHHAKAELHGKTQMLKIAFANRIKVMFAFIQHASIVSQACRPINNMRFLTRMVRQRDFAAKQEARRD